MKEHIIRAILYQDMSVKWKDAELNGDVNVHLNVHQKTRQIVEVELDDFLLSDGEAILASFEKTIDGEIYHENPAKMDKVEGEQCVFRLRIPTLVHNTPGEWGVQFFVVTDYDPITGNYTDAYPFDKAKFSEHSSFIDDGLTVPAKENFCAIYAAANSAQTAAGTSAQEAATSAQEAANSAQEAATSAQEAGTSAQEAGTSAQEAGTSAQEASGKLDEVVEIENRVEAKANLILNVVTDVAKNKGDIKNLYQIAEFNNQFVWLKTKHAYTSRETANGENIADESYAEVTEINGDSVRCENLISFPYHYSSQTYLGVTWTVNADGSVTASGTATSTTAEPYGSTFYFSHYSNRFGLPAGKYFFTCGGGGKTSTYYSRIVVRSADGTESNITDIGSGVEVTINEGDTLYAFARINVGVTVNNFTFKPMLNAGTEALPYQPYFYGLKRAYIDSIKSTGRNLIPYPYKKGTHTTNGVTFTVNDDGSIIVNGTATQTSYFVVSSKLNLIIGKTYYISGTSTAELACRIYRSDGSTYTNMSFIPVDGFTYQVELLVREGKTVSNETVYPMLNHGSTALPYEPYNEETYQLPETLELGEYDTLNPQTGELKRATGRVALIGTEFTSAININPETVDDVVTFKKLFMGTFSGDPATEAENTAIPSALYTPAVGEYNNMNIVIAGNQIAMRDDRFSTIDELNAYLAEQCANGTPVTVDYKLATPTVESVVAVPKNLMSWRNGSETLQQGETDNSKYGAMPTVTQKYISLLGAVDDEE